MVQTQVNIEALNFSFNLPANEWNRLTNSCLFAVIKIFQLEKFHRELSFNSLSCCSCLDIFGILHVGS